jgi:hypothetical protein
MEEYARKRGEANKERQARVEQESRAREGKQEGSVTKDGST